MKRLGPKRSGLRRLGLGLTLAAVCLILVAWGTSMALGTRDRGDSPESEAATGAVTASHTEARSDITSDEAKALPSTPASSPEPIDQQAHCYVGVLVARGDIDVTAKADGTLVASRFAVGDVVQEGQQIAVVSSIAGAHRLEEQAARLEAARTQLSSSEVEVERARRELARRQEASQLFSTEQIEAARFQLQIAELDYQRQQSALKEARAVQLRLQSEEDRGQVLAPFTGRISGTYVLPGTPVRAGQTLLRLVATEEPVVRFAVPAAARDLFPIGTQVTVETASGVEIAVAARVETVAPVLDEASQLIFVEASAQAENWREAPMGAVLRVSTAGSCRDQPVTVLPDGF